MITPHEVFTPFDLAHGGLGTRAAKRVGLLAYGRAASLIICSSRLEMQDTESAGLPASKLTWIHHAVIDERAPETSPGRPARDSGELKVGYLGRLHPKKNVSVLIDAVGRLDPRVSLVVAGRGDAALEHELRRQAEWLLAGRAEFVGWVSSDDKAGFLACVDVLVMPSEYECFGVAAIEALAVGTPVIVSDRVGVAAIVRARRAGQVASPTVESIAEALRRYLDDPQARHADASRARQAAISDASFAAHGARLATEYERVLTARSHG